MSPSTRPFLSEFSVAPSPILQVLDLELDPATGLFRRPGSTKAFIEELLEFGDLPQTTAASMATFLTESSDNPDRDLVRSDLRYESVALALSSSVTKTDDDPDPDLVRAGLT